MLILVVNAGSSSLKYQVRDTSLPEAEQMLTSGLVENIGTDVPNHEVAFDIMSEKLEPVLAGRELQAVGHRVVQGAEKFTHPTLLTEEVVQQIDDLSPLAPLHNPAHAQGMRAAMHKWPSLPQVAISTPRSTPPCPKKHGATRSPTTWLTSTASAATASTAPATSTSPTLQLTCSALHATSSTALSLTSVTARP